MQTRTRSLQLSARAESAIIQSRHSYTARIPRGMSVHLLGSLPEGDKVALFQRRVALLAMPREWKARIVIGDKSRIIPGDLRVVWLTCASRFERDAKFTIGKLFERVIAAHG